VFKIVGVNVGVLEVVAPAHGLGNYDRRQKHTSQSPPPSRRSLTSSSLLPFFSRCIFSVSHNLFLFLNKTPSPQLLACIHSLLDQPKFVIDVERSTMRRCDPPTEWGSPSPITAASPWHDHALSAEQQKMVSIQFNSNK